jgi:hypothetical protein
MANSVKHFINCARRQVPKLWESIGVPYLKFNWLDNDNQVLFKYHKQGDTIASIFDSTIDAMKKTESVLVHSLQGHIRAVSVLAVHLMMKSGGLSKNAQISWFPQA